MYHHTLTNSPEGWRFVVWEDDERDGQSTPMRSYAIADKRGQEHVDRLNGVACVGIEARLAELGL